MDTLSTSIRVAQGLGIIGALFESGAMFSLTNSAIPVILTAPTPIMLTQWRTLFRNGALFFPPLGAVNFSILGFAAYQLYNSSSSSKASYISDGRIEGWKLFATAAVLAVSIIPFTGFFIMPTNKILEGMEEVAKIGGKEVDANLAREMVQKWASLNAIRSTLPLAAGVMGLWAVMR